MSSSSSETRGQLVFWHLGTVTIIVVLAALFMMLAWRAAATAGAEFERQRAFKILSESRLLCEKWGVTAGTPRFTECLNDIQAVRDRQVERIREDDEPL